MQTLEPPRITPIDDPAIRSIDPKSDAMVVDHLTKRFVRKSLFTRKTLQTIHAIEDISFRIRRNEIFGVLGANGSGKSTLIRMMSTLITPDEGSITIFGYDVHSDEAIVKRLINRVSVEASFFKKLSAMENLLYSSRLYGRSGGSLRKDIVEILNALGITPDRIDAPLEQLSRGMQQKVAIARAFLTSPVMLLLDEPTTGLDPRSKKDVQHFVNRLRDEHDATILLCTHDMDEAEQLCDRIAVIDNGRMIELDTAENLKARIAIETGNPATSLEDVFIHLTGRSIEELDAPAGEDVA
jgi:ABC-2 type transport system ATP-binding protein